MTTAADGCITKAEERLRNMLAACTTFQTWVGAATADAAKDSIYYTEVPPQARTEDTTPLAYNVSIRPFALIWTSTSQGFKLHEQLGPSGLLQVRFEDNARSTDPAEAERLFLNTIGKIMQSEDTDNPGLLELSITRQYTQIREMEIVSVFHTDEDDHDTYGDAIAAEMSVAWGVVR